ncbi:hypothetical protein GCM10023194_75550 [Planotetraspora phitsanulokensis]|uniref:Fibronectin type-III domain-containing protein n=1 Tax=Planotetraspora phitsanulokensis TaxID=575192 RepID=A0A8J3XIW2_9ACTN|nr:LamG domain-containing protein [Planotetraspora phitsanulokensis]GII42560.1 hypothetical protein Pph01_75630 [Planotetraspora phitsanulokensis]
MAAITGLLTVCALLTIPAVAHASTANSGLVAAFGMDEAEGTKVGDASPKGNNGRATATTWERGKYGAGLSFSGSSSVTVKDSASLRLSSGMTLEAWVKPATTSGWRTVLLKEQGRGIAYGLFSSDDSGVPAAGVRTGGYREVRSTGFLGEGGWTHLASTYDGRKLRLYIDGVLARQTSVIGAIRSHGGDLTIGGKSVWGGDSFEGTLDEVRIYNRALTAAQIQTDMDTPINPNQPPSGPSGLEATVHYSFVSLDWQAPIFGGDVSSYEIHRSATPGFTPSADTWIGTTTIPYATRFRDEGQPAGVYYYRVVALEGGSPIGPPSNEVSATVETPGDPPSAPGTLTAGGRSDWVRLTYGPATAAFGISHYQLHRSTTPGFTPSPRTWIASITPHVYEDYGLAAGVYYYRLIPVDYAGQVGQPSNEASARVPDQPPTAPTLSVQGGAGRAELSWTAAADDDGVAAYRVWRGIELIGTVTSRTLTDIGLSAGRYSYSVEAVDTAGQPGEMSNVAFAQVAECPPAACLVAAYGFDEGTGTTFTDGSGSGNDGTTIGTTWADGRFGKALSFSADTADAIVPDSPTVRLDTGMTVEAWVYPTEITSYHAILFKGDEQTSSYGLSASVISNEEVPTGPSVRINDYRIIVSPTPLPANTWSHVAATFADGTVRIYVNGIEVAQEGDLPSSFRQETGPLTIGRDSRFGQHYKGLIDEIRIYSTPLTAEQIQADMNTPVGTQPR